MMAFGDVVHSKTEPGLKLPEIKFFGGMPTTVEKVDEESALTPS